MWRSGLIAAALAAVLSSPAAPAAAQCVSAADLARGVQFTRQQGQQGYVMAAGNGRVQVDYRMGEPGYRDVELRDRGVYVVRAEYLSAPPDVIGVFFDSETTYRISGRPPVPTPGEEWRTTVSLSYEASDHSGMPTSERTRVDAVYRFLPEEMVTLSGCQYRMIPIELTMSNREGSAMERSVYFPDLGFAIRTQVSDPRTGALVPNGLTAMRPGG